MSGRLVEMNLPRFPLLKDQEMKELLGKAKAGDGYARDRLINCNLKLVFNLVKRFQNRGYELEDLFQIGCIGLIKAIDKFDPSYEVKFSTYAVPMIIGEIRRFLRDDNPVKVSRSVKEIAYKIQQVRDILTAKLSREPSVGEIAADMGLSREEVVNALEAAQAPTSIYETLHQDDGDPIYLLDQLKGKEDGETPWLERISMKELLNNLPERDRQIIAWRFFEDKTQSDIAQKLGLSQVQVSRLERQALKKLKELMEKSG
ncbi:RNA polymerase sporulation sigma factor SigF [Pelotomaculum terephthalicicum JT]|uniref:RNA polymerase sporulation sigma factor SigF n=1 Tax=Pelotomaculum TaxID=191373 RepID=UPI0009CD4B12|nr:MULTISPECIES: RNA polymerase sporulation sigma factor SigF [Pelotomaculum]MCG9968837.1 RNA polymerase sporulation sigma factor SigF [Pelotomaculum terephthalicicum JT]OPX85102.1 MAG: RNA polymerase sigma-F factor [Pelotomaculum sp. PtaB.Bin117]OPY59505.1 MAG: RNA polymerase sigma-F factor [Pelotomaculum sp. PtaU1.Bin035]